MVWGVAPGEGLPADRADFWVTGLDRDRAEPAGLVGPVSRAGGTLGAIEDMSWTEQGLVFSMRSGWVRNVYRCRMTPGGKARGDLVRLAGGTASAEFPAVSREGQMVFAAEPGASTSGVCRWTPTAGRRWGHTTGSPTAPRPPNIPRFRRMVAGCSTPRRATALRKSG